MGGRGEDIPRTPCVDCSNTFSCARCNACCLPFRFEAPEALFNPSLVEVEGPGLSDLVFELIQVGAG